MYVLHALTSVLLTLSIEGDSTRASASAAARWKLNTHVFAANLALADALDDKHVTIPPYGAIPVNADALRALSKFPDDFRGGVVGPDVFPDIYVGQSLAHADKSAEHDRWTSDDWLQHLFRQARAWRSRPWSKPDEDPDRVLAFAYGFLVHAAGDVFGHSYVNDWGDGQRGGQAYAWDWVNPIVVARHVVLESYVSKFTPPTNDTIDVWPRFAAELLIKHPAILDHTKKGAPHYQHWMRMHRWLGKSIEQATAEINGESCALHPAACARKAFFVSWQDDINRGLRNLVEANLVLGRAILAHRVTDGIKAFQDWNSEWTLKMHGAHAPAEVMKWIAEHDPLAPLKDSVATLAIEFLKNQYPREFAYLRMMSRPAHYMDSVYAPNGPSVRAAVNADMQLGPDSLLKWTRFAPLYNTVILTKLALLDGRGLNELARRAGIPTPLYPETDRANVMLSVVKSMDGHRQWEGEPYGMRYRPYTGRVATSGKAGAPREVTAASVLDVASGFPFWGDPAAREKIFGRIFKGYGPGPGEPVLTGTPNELPAGKDAAGTRRPPAVTTPRPVAVPRRDP